MTISLHDYCLTVSQHIGIDIAFSRIIRVKLGSVDTIASNK